MTISSNVARKEHAGDGTTSAFTTSPVVFYDSDTLTVKVVTTATGGAVTLVENTDYTVSGGAGAVGTIDLSAGSSPYGAPSASEYVVILRTEPYIQEDDFVNNSASDAEVVEQRLDKVTMEIQQLLEIADRSIKLSDVETGTSANSTIPYDRNDKYLAFDSSGNFVVVAGLAASEISDYWFTVVTAADSAASQVLLDLEPGVDIQAYDADLEAIAALPPADGAFIVGDGATWVAETGATARTSIGLGVANLVTFAAVTATTSASTFHSITATTADSNFSSSGETRIAAGATTVAATGADGSLRVDTTLNELRYYAGGAWRTVKIAGTEPAWIPAKAWDPAVTNGAELVTTNEATTSGLTYATLNFDGSTNEKAFFGVEMPKGWDLGTIKFRPVWTAASGSGTVIFNLSAVALSDDDAIDTAFGTAASSTDTLLAAGDIHIGPESAAITVANTPAALDMVFLQLERNASSDTHAVDAKLLGALVTFTSNAKDAS